MTTPNQTDLELLKHISNKEERFSYADAVADAIAELTSLRTRLAELEAVVNGPVKILYAADYAGWTYEFVLKNPHPLYLTREACEASHRPLPDTENSPTSAPTDRGTG